MYRLSFESTKRVLIPFSILSLILFSSFKVNAPKHTYKIKTIVIDPGHGGHDSGCLGSSAKEKHVALAVSLKLGKMIEEKYPDVKVVYTRTTDVFVELHERADIANQNHADLFICVHCNSGPPSAFGTETYVMGLHKTDDNLSVAKRENSSILLEKDYKTNYDGFDPNSPEANIIFTLYQNSYLTQSLKFASLVQQQFEEYGGRYNRGVKQAGFLVLYRTAMPSVLIEGGFLTNSTEERYMNSEKGQHTLATSIYRAFVEYKLDMETTTATTETYKENTKPDVPKQTPVAINDDKKQVESVKNQEIKIETENENEKPAKGSKTTPNPKSDKAPESVKADSGDVKKVTEPKPKVEKAEGAKALPKVYFTIQVGALPDPSESDLERFKQLGSFSKIKLPDGLTRINFGVFSSQTQASQKLAGVRSKGFSDAFITAYDGDKKITPQQAQKLLK